MITTAKARFVRISSRKVKLVIDLIRGKSVEEAFNILRFTHKAAAEPVRKLVQSAFSNAVNQLGSFDLDTHRITVSSIRVDQGPTFKRWRPRAMGRATPIMKRTSHITVELNVPEPEEQHK
ncbi:MAG: 50S ribosomal protein L22 [Candidatus Glassbacteria bacterium]